MSLQEAAMDSPPACSFLRDIVDGIPVSQALRTLKNSQMDHDKTTSMFMALSGGVADFKALCPRGPGGLPTNR